jgi:hypothetical protein
VLKTTTLERYFRKIDVTDDLDGCWEWNAATTERLYGNFWGPETGMSKAHRVMYFLVHGWWPEVVRHSCDNPPCCNPAHLLGGTQEDNMGDMWSRGRQASHIGRKTSCILDGMGGTSTMLNFRVKDEWADRLDAAAERVGLNRSDFIRSSLEQRVEEVLGGAPTPARPRLTPPKVQKVARNQCPHPQVTKLPTGIKLCQSCGAKLR